MNFKPYMGSDPYWLSTAAKSVPAGFTNFRYFDFGFGSILAEVLKFLLPNFLLH